MSYSIRVGGVWKTDPDPSIRVGGVWKTPDSMHIRVGGVWKEVWTAATISANVTNQTAYTEKISPTDATAGYKLLSNGIAQKTSINGTYVSISGEWETGGSPGSAYDAYVTVTSGSLSTGTAGSWVNLGTNRTWTRLRSGVGTSTCIFTVQIRDANTLTVLDSASITLTAVVSN